MLQVLQILSILLGAVGLALTLAHALELPGKRRLDRVTYFAVQSIYYPGFTIGAVFGEVGAIIVTLLAFVFTPSGTSASLLTLAGLCALLSMHGLYWVMTHPVNRVWLEGTKLGKAGHTFFGDPDDKSPSHASAGNTDWMLLRDRWEYSHVMRAGCALLALIALTAAVVAD